MSSVKDARDLARRWVIQEASQAPTFRGAFYAGSTNWFPAEATLPATSDVDITVVLDGPNLPNTRGMLLYRGVLLDVSYAPIDRFQSPDLILSDYHLAG